MIVGIGVLVGLLVLVSILLSWSLVVAHRRQKLWGLWLYFTQELHGGVHGGIVETCPKAFCSNFVRTLEKVVGAKAIDAVRRAAPKSRKKSVGEWQLEKEAAAIGRAIFNPESVVIRPIPTKAVGAASADRPRPQLDVERAASDNAYYEEHRAYFLGFCQKVSAAESRYQAQRPS